MKILVVTNLFPPNAIGGYERLVAEIATDLAARGHEVRVLTSNFGGAVPAPEVLPVRRTLELLTGDTIYRPFAGSDRQRDHINRRNAAELSRAIEELRPDAVLVGNLFFLDRSILGPLRVLGAKVVYLLTDVWRIHFENDIALQDYFRTTVFDPQPPPPIVPPNSPGVISEKMDSAQAWETANEMMRGEFARRRGVESALAAGRSAFQYGGVCHLCGATVFSVTMAGAATLMMSARDETACTCGRCGLDGDTRGLLHLLDKIAPADEGTVIVSDAAIREALMRRLPGLRVADGASFRDGRDSCRFVVVLDRATSDDDLSRIRSRIQPDGLLVSARAPGPFPREQGAVLFRYWSRECGYFGREHQIMAIRV